MPGKLADIPAQTKTIKAAGAVAWRPGPAGEPEILLVHRAKYDDWSLPKGKAEPGELLPGTAIREVFEEAGARLVLGRRLKPARYKVNGRAKVVTYWSARLAGTDSSAVPNGEVDKITWLTMDQARKHVTYAHDVVVIDDFAAAPADTVPLIVARHARALPRDGWRGDDAYRPLDDQGRADAQTLAGLLACFAPRAQVVSSATVRCLDTVRPYAERAGAPVRAALELRVSRTTPPDSAALLAAVASSGTPTMLCAHRENLPGLMAAAAAALGERSLPSACADPLPTAAFVIFHASAGTFVGADRYELADS
jgi:8-oxo-dGTP pyrophosphatase MutT (NUDIX family)/phosphohistidine phosphatase SixA